MKKLPGITFCVILLAFAMSGCGPRPIGPPEPIGPPPGEGLPQDQQPGTNPETGPLPGGTNPENPEPPAPPPASGGIPAPTNTTSAGGVLGVVAEVDLAVAYIYPDSSGKVMLVIKNAGNVPVNWTAGWTCFETYTTAGGASGNNTSYPPTNMTNYFDVGAKTEYDTGWSRDPSISSMTLACTITPPAGDVNSANDSSGTTKIK